MKGELRERPVPGPLNVKALFHQGCWRNCSGFMEHQEAHNPGLLQEGLWRGGLASCAVTKLLPQLQTHSSLLCFRMLSPTLLTIFSLCQLLPTRLRLQGVPEGDRWVGELTSHPCECQADAARRQQPVNPLLVSPTVWKIQTAWDAPLCCCTTPVFVNFFCTDTVCTSFYWCSEAAKKHPSAADTQNEQMPEPLTLLFTLKFERVVVMLKVKN